MQLRHARLGMAFALGVLGSFAAFGAPDAPAAGNVDGFRANIEKWVETRQIISKEKTDWDTERAALVDTKAFLQDQKKILAAEIAELEASNTQSDEERRDLLLERGEFQRSNRELESEIRAMEESVLELAAQLPPPLQKKIELLLVQIPKDPENGAPPVGQRLMNVLGILAQAEKFNATATFVGETRAVDGEEKVQVRTLYWGLGQAIYADSQGDSAGVGHPGANGWEFSNQPDLAADAGLLLDIYEGNVDRIEFVEIPVEIH